MSYTILGKKILNEYIALGVYGTVALGVFAATRGGSDKAKVTMPEITSTSDDETAFIKDFVAKLEAEEAPAKH